MYTSTLLANIINTRSIFLSYKSGQYFTVWDGWVHQHVEHLQCICLYTLKCMMFFKEMLIIFVQVDTIQKTVLISVHY